MKINDINVFLEKQKEKANVKSDEKIYSNLIHIISELKWKDLTPQQWQMIEIEFERLGITEVEVEGNNRLKKKHMLFIRFLKNRFSLIPENYYTTLGTSIGYILGAAIGMVVGIILSISTGLIYGMILGSMIGLTAGFVAGKLKDNLAEKENRTIKARLKKRKAGK